MESGKKKRQKEKITTRRKEDEISKTEEDGYRPTVTEDVRRVCVCVRDCAAVHTSDSVFGERTVSVKVNTLSQKK